jgi:hypothetical protein
MSHRVCNPVKWQPQPRTRTNCDPTRPTGNNHYFHKNFPEMLMIWAEISVCLFSRLRKFGSCDISSRLLQVAYNKYRYVSLNERHRVYVLTQTLMV